MRIVCCAADSDDSHTDTSCLCLKFTMKLCVLLPAVSLIWIYVEQGKWTREREREKTIEAWVLSIKKNTCVLWMRFELCSSKCSAKLFCLSDKFVRMYLMSTKKWWLFNDCFGIDSSLSFIFNLAYFTKLKLLLKSKCIFVLDTIVSCVLVGMDTKWKI